MCMGPFSSDRQHDSLPVTIFESSPRPAPHALPHCRVYLEPTVVLRTAGWLLPPPFSPHRAGLAAGSPAFPQARSQAAVCVDNFGRGRLLRAPLSLMDAFYGSRDNEISLGFLSLSTVSTTVT